jgi:hypothetical protein
MKTKLSHIAQRAGLPNAALLVTQHTAVRAQLLALAAAREEIARLQSVITRKQMEQLERAHRAEKLESITIKVVDRISEWLAKSDTRRAASQVKYIFQNHTR